MSGAFDQLTRAAEISTDFVFKWWPRAELTSQECSDCKLIAHRGCHDSGKNIYENTLAAFEAAKRAGVWGVEFDVQWTRDMVPVVIHDPDTARLPGEFAVEVKEVDFQELRNLSPLVPRLEEVIEQCAGTIHMMIELKGDPFNSVQNRIVHECLLRYDPCENFHLMSLDARSLRSLRKFPEQSLLLIATVNTRIMFDEFKRGGFGGFTGHYLLLNRNIRRNLAQKGVPWGTGFVNSVNLLAREIRSGTRWIFSDAAEFLVNEIPG